MDQKERLNEHQLEEAIRRGHDLVKSQIWTAMPVKIVSYNATEQSAVVQPLIQSKVRQSDGTYKDRDMPQIRDVPVQHPSGGGWTLTMPLKPGDEGTVEFQSRCIDHWWLPPGNAKAGSTQPQAEMRMHDLNDAIFKPGARSKPRWLKDVSTTTTQLRSDDGKSYIELAAGDNGGSANLVFPDGLTITCGNTKIEITTDHVNITSATVHVIGGQVEVDKEVTANYGGSGIGSNIHLSTHKHGGVQVGSGETDVPVPGS